MWTWACAFFPVGAVLLKVSPRLAIEIVASAATGSYLALAKLVEASEFLALANAALTPTKTLCRCHFQRRPRGGDIHRRAAEIALHSLHPPSDRALLLRPADPKSFQSWRVNGLNIF